MESLPAPILSGGRGTWDVACLSPGSLGLISLGCVVVGALDAPGQREPACAGGLSASGVELHLPPDPRVEGTCVQPGSTEIRGSLPSPSVPR